MNIDIYSYNFRIIGAIWFTVPILSWLWSLGSLFCYRRLTKQMNEATKAYEQAKVLNEQMLSYRLETMELRTKAEEEIKLASRYYVKIADMLTKTDDASPN